MSNKVQINNCLLINVAHKNIKKKSFLATTGVKVFFLNFVINPLSSKAIRPLKRKGLLEWGVINRVLNREQGEKPLFLFKRLAKIGENE